VSKVFIISFF